jgi:AraC-like DNA-binding protein
MKKDQNQIVVFDIAMQHWDQEASLEDAIHGHDFHEFYFTLEGDGEQYTRDKVFKMKRGDLFFFPAGQEHCASGGIRGSSVAIVLWLRKEAFSAISEGDAEVLKIIELMTSLALDGKNKFPLSAEGQRQIRNVLNDMLSERDRKENGFRCAMKMLCSRFMLIILRESKLAIKDSGETFGRFAREDRIEEVCSFIKNNYSTRITVDQVIRMSNMSRSHFHTVFKQVTGKTFVQYLSSVRVEAVMDMLRKSDISAARAAELCGFSSVSNFYSIFRRITGLTPKDIQKPRA